MKILCVLYDDPVTGYPTAYARDDLPGLTGYPGGQTVPTPSSVDFTRLLGGVAHRTRQAEVPGSVLNLTFHPPGVDIPNATSARSTRRCTPETEGLFDDDLIAKTKHGAYLINTARGARSGRPGTPGMCPARACLSGSSQSAHARYRGAWLTSGAGVRPPAPLALSPRPGS
ncbi:NAD(P)-dependent oxidoreductase [Lentzea sp. E54]|uniref:NAD(P)-dependent oxidoreductase n=1 Tax=Lentzea xerophila TaxID=3435883 RepID=UPI003DA43B4C